MIVNNNIPPPKKTTSNNSYKSSVTSSFPSAHKLYSAASNSLNKAETLPAAAASSLSSVQERICLLELLNIMHIGLNFFKPYFMIVITRAVNPPISKKWISDS